MLTLEGVSKRFGTVTALHPVDLEVPPGEFLVLLGPSGCGKSTLLRIVAGLEEPTAGCVRFAGRDVTWLPPRERNVAMVFQSYALYPHLTVRENLSFGLEMRRTPREETRRRVASMAGLLELGALLDRFPSQLSGGQKQRVALGRALVREPALFLLDEPLSNLDAELRAGTRAELMRLHRRLGITTLYVTHDQVEAMTMGQRIVVLRGGVVQQVGAPAEVYGRPANAFVAGFVGQPPMNLVASPARGDGERVLVQVGEARLLLEGRRFHPDAAASGRPVLVGIRPEALRPPEEDGLRIEGEVELVEPLGREAIVTLVCGKERLRALVAPDAAPGPGARLARSVPPDAVQLFDLQTGVSLLR
jgi:multiple sugar transport system ATP-binding protein